MDRRLLTVLGASLLFALVVSSIFYQMTTHAGKGQKAEDTETRDLVVAAQALPVGVNIKPDDVRIVPVAKESFPKGAFSSVEEVLERPVISNILFEEPVLAGRLADRGSGLGLAPIIPVGMRAVAARVNDVVGVAGFVLPGMRVDVLVTGRPPSGEELVTTTVLQNILVLSAGENIQPDSRGQPINVPVVTLLVTPEQAEILTLAGSDGRIQLVLRNGADQEVTKTVGRHVAQLYGGLGSAPKPKAPVRKVPERPKTPVVVSPPRDEIVVIRGTEKTVEVLPAREHN